jgi:tetratricopeptide (TPR) repeat protein
MKGPSPERVAEFAAAARRIVVERTNAADVVSQLLRETPREEWLSLASRPELQNNGALERLSREIDTALDRQPQDALPLSLLATTIADGLPEDRYPAVVTAQLRAHAWKDRAQALTFSGKHNEALEAIECAEGCLETFGTVAHDQAIVWLVKALVLQRLDRFDEALSLLTRSRRIFEMHRDEKRQLSCGIAEGVQLFRQGHMEAACAVLEPLLDIARANHDSTSLAAIHNNLAHCLIDLGKVTEANIHASEAVAHFNNGGNYIDAVRTEMAIGRLFAARGRTTEALLRLRAARRDFAEHGMVEEAGICGLDISATLLAENRESEAQTIFEVAVIDLRQMNERARIALAHLSARFAAHDATPAAVRHVSEYIALLRQEPSVDFEALQ